MAVRSDDAAAPGPCGHAQVELSDPLRRHLPTCPSLEAVLAAVADSGKIRALKRPKLYPIINYKDISYGISGIYVNSHDMNCRARVHSEHALYCIYFQVSQPDSRRQPLVQLALRPCHHMI